MYKNRITQEVEEALSLFKCIAEKAKGSYGLLYFHDDEDVSGKDNFFQVYVLARGAIKTMTDTFLSPLVPVVEEQVCAKPPLSR
ncbi:MAG: immunity 7 family protein [Cystobacterineae bacterium]|nr:immunity 7 family protein [Cystobacterineae bacterium]